MATAKCNWPISFNHADKMLGNSRSSIRIGHNTTLTRTFSGEILARYHGNPIVRYLPHDYAVSNAGWNTVTTSGRLHDALQALHSGEQTQRHQVNIRNGQTFLDQKMPITEEWLSVN